MYNIIVGSTLRENSHFFMNSAVGSDIISVRWKNILILNSKHTILTPMCIEISSYT